MNNKSLNQLVFLNRIAKLLVSVWKKKRSSFKKGDHSGVMHVWQERQMFRQFYLEKMWCLNVCVPALTKRVLSIDCFENEVSCITMSSNIEAEQAID